MDPNGRAAKWLLIAIFGVALSYIFLLIMMDAMQPATP